MGRRTQRRKGTKYTEDPKHTKDTKDEGHEVQRRKVTKDTEDEKNEGDVVRRTKLTKDEGKEGRRERMKDAEEAGKGHRVRRGQRARETKRT